MRFQDDNRVNFAVELLISTVNQTVNKIFDQTKKTMPSTASRKQKLNKILAKRKMTKIMQNLVIFMEPSKDTWQISLKGANMYMNRFLIDEDVAFEFSGVHYLAESSLDVMNNDFQRKSKEK